MQPGTTHYVLGGDTFTGTFEIAGEAPSATVTVRYKQEEASAVTSGLAPEVVARVLLGELVRDDIAGRNRARMLATRAGVGNAGLPPITAQMA